MESFHFSLSDLKFRQWLYEGLSENGKPLSDGLLQADTRTFQENVRDGFFNGAELSQRQIRFLCALFKGEKILVNDKGEIILIQPTSGFPPSRRRS